MGNKLYVGNLAYSVTDQTLMDAFNQYGEVGSAKVIMDRETGRSKGFGFVEMLDSQDATLAIEKLNGKNCDGRPMTVNEARPSVPRNNNGGGYGSSRHGQGY
ncbi:MAG: RNA-binding protein [Pseudobdellovibrionaceae bacterium]|uniref:RNA recognition motif domain-containing protein n=1 Tax=Oligoflexus sp. TaxID=1971216 RepID=UPI0027C22FE0|nr:RNA-binding protein [Oligoflexus sp.]MDQ3234013.1 RNA-binding protein [Pseudobdellovibrionaceae bacterium]HYX33455.1 RNA-binding protein [Oligoflexus sp.]